MNLLCAVINIDEIKKEHMETIMIYTTGEFE